MNVGKIIQKLKDLYGWDQSQLYLQKDKRAYYGALAESAKQKMTQAKDVKAYNKAKWEYEGCQELFDKADFFVRNNETDSTEDNWRNRN
jgi:hypothetical protein